LNSLHNFFPTVQNSESNYVHDVKAYYTTTRLGATLLQINPPQ